MITFLRRGSVLVSLFSSIVNPYVRRVRLYGCWGSPVITACAPALDGLTCVRSLQLNDVLWPRMDIHISSPRSSACASMQHTLQCKIYISQLANFICTFSCLERLVLDVFVALEGPQSRFSNNLSHSPDQLGTSQCRGEFCLCLTCYLCI
jgi:hypothetical protein